MGWITLYEAYSRLKQKYATLLADQAYDIIEVAIKSRQPFVRGRALGRSSHEPIGDAIKSDYRVDVFGSQIGEWKAERWVEVQVQWEKFILYLEENLLPTEISARREQASRRKRSRRRGPARNSVGYSKLDAEHFPAMERLIASGESRSPYAAALNLVRAGKVRGSGSPENIAKRLAARFLKERHRRSTR
jgi:hypothetical protein